MAVGRIVRARNLDPQSEVFASHRAAALLRGKSVRVRQIQGLARCHAVQRSTSPWCCPPFCPAALPNGGHVSLADCARLRKYRTIAAVAMYALSIMVRYRPGPQSRSKNLRFIDKGLAVSNA